MKHSRLLLVLVIFKRAQSCSKMPRKYFLYGLFVSSVNFTVPIRLYLFIRRVILFVADSFIITPVAFIISPSQNSTVRCINNRQVIFILTILRVGEKFSFVFARYFRAKLRG